MGEKIKDLEANSSNELRSKYKGVLKKTQHVEEIFVDISMLFAELFLKGVINKKDSVKLSEKSKLLLREFLYFQLVRNDNISSEDKSRLGDLAVTLMDSFESEAIKTPTLNDYHSRMRSLSDTFYAWLPEILDQGKIKSRIDAKQNA